MPFIDCVVCGTRVPRRAHNQRYCSLTCKRHVSNRKWHSQPANKAKVKVYGAARYLANRDRIRAVQAKWRAANPEAIRELNHRYRLSKRSVVSEPYTLAEIYDRDKGICQICHKRVNPRLKRPSVRGPSIDHIIPLAQGGNNTRANVQLAHYSCNTKKSHFTVPSGEQLRIVG